MIIRRCAWHRAYHSYPMTTGIASWHGRGISFTDGMCRGCAIRFRRQWNLPPMPSPPPRLAPASAFMRGAVSIAMVAMLVLAVRSSDSVRLRATMTLPPETVLVPTPVADPAPTVPGPPAPRRARPAVSRRAPSAVAAVVGQPRRARPAVSRRAPSAVAAVVEQPARATRPAPSFSSTEPDADAIVLTSVTDPSDTDAMEPTRVSATWSRFPAMSLFAALPPAGLTHQAP